MMTIRLKGFITESRELKVDLPDDIPAGEVDLVIEMPGERPANGEDAPWTAEEIAEMLTPDPRTGEQIVELGHTGGWAQLGIEDSQAWVDARRRERGRRA